MSGEGTQAVHGWGCTPTADPTETSKPRLLHTIFVRRWQRTALFVILTILMMIVFLNIALTLWIITSLKLSMNSIGPLKIMQGGIQLEGEAQVAGRLIASSIRSKPAQPITIYSHRNFSILVSDGDQKEYSKLLIKRDSFECGGKVFEVTDARGGTVFRASREEVRVAAETLAMDGAGGVNVRSAVQTPIVRAPPGSDLQLESQTRRLDLRAPQLIHLESRAGNIDITSHSHIQLNSVVGALKIDAQNIFINKLRQATPVTSVTPKNKSEKTVKVFQLCACASGKLFLAAPEGLCAQHSEDLEMCR